MITLPQCPSFFRLTAAVLLGCTFSLAAPAAWAQKTKPAPAKATAEIRQLPKSVTLLGHTLTEAERQKSDKVFLAEFVSKPETLDNWTILFAVRHELGKNYTARGFVTLFADRIKQRRQDGDQLANFAVVEDIADGSWYIDFVSSDMPAEVIEHNIFRYFNVPNGVVSLQYARRAFVGGAKAKRTHLWRKDAAAAVAPMELGLELMKSIEEQGRQIIAELSLLEVGIEPLPLELPKTSDFKPTPQMAFAWKKPADDMRDVEFEVTNTTRYLFAGQYTFQDAPANSTDERLELQVDFPGQTLRTFADRWLKKQAVEHRLTKMSEKTQPDGSLLFILRSVTTKELSIHKLHAWHDGIYRIAYYCPDEKKSDSFQPWSKSVENSRLVFNPARLAWRGSLEQKEEP